MKKLLKNSLQYLFCANAFLALYILTQGILSLLFFVPACFHNKQSEDLFYYGMLSIYKNSTSQFEVILNSIPLMTQLFSGFMYQITILSGLVIIGVYFFSNISFLRNSIPDTLISSNTGYYKNRLHTPLRSFVLLYIAGIGLNLFVSAIVNICCRIFPQLNAWNNTVSATVSGSFIPALLAVGIIAPVTEEIVFRYGMLHKTNQIRPEYALLFSSILFGLMHINPIQIVYASILGFFFGKLYLKTKKLSIPILLHVGINSSSVIIETLSSSLSLH